MPIKFCLPHILFSVLVLGVAAAVLYELEHNKSQHTALAEAALRTDAMADFDTIVLMRRWNALHGGVFVKGGGLEPNPYLPDNTLATADGQQLIRVNPAWMTRQLSELAAEFTDHQFRITSLKPINPINAPDAFETEALMFLQQNRQEDYVYHLDAEQQRFHLVGRLLTESSCLQCHAEQGYKLGDIRGAIHISMPVGRFYQEQIAITQSTRLAQATVAILTLLTLILVMRYLSTQTRYRQAIQHINADLEQKVQQRTQRLQQLYEKEKQTKDLLRTAAHINELLLTAMSTSSVLSHCVDALSQYPHYCFSWVGLVKEGQLQIAKKSKDSGAVLELEFYALSEDNPAQVRAAVLAVKQMTFNITSIEPTLWQIALPLIVVEDEQKQVLGVLCVQSIREQGFGDEEIKVLERLAGDIALILQSLQQKTLVQRMEAQRINHYEETILAFVNIIEQRDNYTAGHTLRVADYCVRLGQFLQLPPTDIERLSKAAILHDIGKVATPDAILLKPERLNGLEYELIQRHVYAGFDMLSKIDMYKELAGIILFHHAHYDGHGYPKTEHPDKVPFLSFVLAVADAFDAMTTSRIYKPRLSVADALAEIKRHSGSQFHPVVAQAALLAFEDVKPPMATQMPSTELEKMRFAYFFNDALTGLYNESYLQVVCSNKAAQPGWVGLLFLTGFNAYNLRHGWREGDAFLKALGALLQQYFPALLVFRFQGDDFIVLSESPLAIDEPSLMDLPLLREAGVSVVWRSVFIKQLSLAELHDVILKVESEIS
ncbi:MAG: DUF3365 domain-containing protein [Methylococcales bacterium]|nr:DUF3365 domain-containing protein [Methylococcales bacterium]